MQSGKKKRKETKLAQVSERVKGVLPLYVLSKSSMIFLLRILRVGDGELSGRSLTAVK
jgi:hypothetical protein